MATLINKSVANIANNCAQVVIASSFLGVMPLKQWSGVVDGAQVAGVVLTWSPRQQQALQAKVALNGAEELPTPPAAAAGQAQPGQSVQERSWCLVSRTHAPHTSSTRESLQRAG